MMGRAGPASNLAHWRRLLSELHAYGPQIAGIIVLNLAAVPLGLMTPLPLKIAVEFRNRQ